jgi:hypothetical protein
VRFTSTQEASRKILKKRAAARLKALNPVLSARHSGKNAPSGCLEGTRVVVLGETEEWAKTLSPEEGIYWISGLAGIGKSALMRSLCDRLAELGILGASFFISRTDKERQDPENVVRTIAYQLARFSPIILAPISDSILRNPDITHSSLTEQVHHLLAVPLSSIARLLEKPVVIVIDGLDESTKDERGREGGDLLVALFAVIEGCSGKVKLMISSRPERTI